jgi:hypothetical protein
MKKYITLRNGSSYSKKWFKLNGSQLYRKEHGVWVFLKEVIM